MKKSFRLITFVIIILLFFSITLVTADASSDDDSTSVSNDGEVENVNENNTSSKNEEKISKSYKGTGKIMEFQDKQINQNEEVLNFLKPSKIIGSDDRVRVNNTNNFPYSAIVHLSVKYPNNRSKSYGCTGFLVGKDTVVTAGHCIYNSSRGGWATNVSATPGRNGASTPFKTYQAKRLYSVKGWTEKRKPEYDYGAVKLNGSPGSNTGWFGYRTTNSSDLNPVGKSATISGYPGDKVPIRTMWRDTDTITHALDRLLLYKMDTYDGQSGSPVYRKYSDTGQTAIAIHTGSMNGPYNRGTRITLNVFNNIKNWKNK